jgi:hypothetical protein
VRVLPGTRSRALDSIRSEEAIAMELSALFAAVLSRALAKVKAKSVAVFTFALYQDHESGAVSVCVDTEENSQRTVQQINEYNARHFMKAVAKSDMKGAGMWQANVGRSLSLGDFELVNLARTRLGKAEINEEFYLSMVRALIAVQNEVAALAPDPQRLVFVCSGPDDEVAYVWSLPASD